MASEIARPRGDRRALSPPGWMRSGGKSARKTLRPRIAHVYRWCIGPCLFRVRVYVGRVSVTADAIAMKLGIAKTAMVRVRAGIGYALTEAMDEGHCGLPEEELGPLAAKLLEVPGELIRSALDLELAEGTVVADTVGEIPCIFLGGLQRAERAIAGRLLGC